MLNQKEYLNLQTPEWLNEFEIDRIYTNINQFMQELKDREQRRLNVEIDLEDRGSSEGKYIRLMAFDLVLKREGITKAQFYNVCYQINTEESLDQ